MALEQKSKIMTIEIEGARFETVEKFAEFIHYGKIKDIGDCIEELYILGKKYEIPDLMVSYFNFSTQLNSI